MSCNLSISGSLIVSGNLTVLNTASIAYLAATYTTASYTTITGSTIFGSSSNNTHQFIGSLSISGGNSIFQQQSIILNAGSNIGITSPNISDYSGLYQAGNNLVSSTDTGNSLNNTYYIMAYYAGGNFGSTLQSAINSVPSGSIIDCSLWTLGAATIASPIIINKPVKIILGPYDINVSFTGPASLTNHAFNIASNGVTIEGFSRSPKSNASPVGETRIIMTETGDGYHIFGTGSNNITVQNLDLLGVQSCCSYDLTTGVGGVCFIEPNPGVSGAGNTTNGITLSNLFVSGTRDHGIYFVGSIMSTVKDCRISSAGGHGFFTTAGSTSTYFYNCYASSGNLAGFCIHSTSYSTLENCAAEGFGMGYWIRSSNNVSLISCGAEENNTPAEGAPLSDLGITFPNSSGTYTVDDWSSDLDNYLKGTSYVITGGENIVLNAPYSRNPNGDNGGTNVFHYYIALGSENVTLINPKCSNTTGFPDLLNYDIAIFSSTVKNTMLFFDPSTGGTVTPTVAGVYITETNSPGSNDTVILDTGQRTQVIGGGKIYKDTEFYRASINQGNGTNTITGIYANALGYNLSASGDYQTVLGYHNVPSNRPRFTVGVGSDSRGKKDGFRVDVDTTLSASIMVPTNVGNPASTYFTTGSMYFIPSSNQLKIFNGNAWRTILTS
jgi:hypothetical protein